MQNMMKLVSSTFFRVFDEEATIVFLHEIDSGRHFLKAPYLKLFVYIVCIFVFVFGKRS